MIFETSGQPAPTEEEVQFEAQEIVQRLGPRPLPKRRGFFTYFFCTKIGAKMQYINEIIYTFRTFVFYNIF